MEAHDCTQETGRASRPLKRAARDPAEGLDADGGGLRPELDSALAMDERRQLRPRRASNQPAGSASSTLGAPAQVPAASASKGSKAYVDESDKFADGGKPRGGGGARGCRCNRTKCLKQYCACFRKDVRCMFTCSCQDCFNDGHHEVERAQAIRLIRVNHPTAFKGTALELEDQKVYSPSGSLLKEIRGCRCKMSKCQKKYCECFGANLKCSANCVCTGCQNGNEQGGQGILPETLEALSKPTLGIDPDKAPPPRKRSADAALSQGGATPPAGQAWQREPNTMALGSGTLQPPGGPRLPMHAAPVPQRDGVPRGHQRRANAGADPLARQELPQHFRGLSSKGPITPTIDWDVWEAKERAEPIQLNAYMQLSPQQQQRQEFRGGAGGGGWHSRAQAPPVWHSQRPPLPYGHPEQRRLRPQARSGQHEFMELERYLSAQEQQEHQQQQHLVSGLNYPMALNTPQAPKPAELPDAPAAALLGSVSAGLSFMPMAAAGVSPSNVLSVGMGLSPAPTNGSVSSEAGGGEGSVTDVPAIEGISTSDDFDFKHAFAELPPAAPLHRTTPSPVLSRGASSLWSMGTHQAMEAGVLSDRALMSPAQQPSPRGAEARSGSGAHGSLTWSPVPPHSPKAESSDWAPMLESPRQYSSGWPQQQQQPHQQMLYSQPNSARQRAFLSQGWTL